MSTARLHWQLSGAGDKVNFKGKPIVAIAYGQKGLMADLSLSGSRYKYIGDAEDYSKYGVPIHRFVVTADVSDPARRGSSTAQMTIEIQDWITDDQRAALRGVIATDGVVAARSAMAEMPAVGRIKGAGKTTLLQWARAVEMPDDQWRINPRQHPSRWSRRWPPSRSDRRRTSFRSSSSTSTIRSTSAPVCC